MTEQKKAGVGMRTGGDDVKYRKKPVVIDVFEFTGQGDMPEVELQMHESNTDWYCGVCGKMSRKHGKVKTLEGYHLACPGDMIIRGVKGEHYPCKSDIFQATYEPVTDAEPEKSE